MTSALEIGGAFLFMATLLIAVMFLAAFQLGRLVTRDDEQRAVEVVRAPKMAVARPRDGHSMFTRGRIWHFDWSDQRGAERWRPLA